MKKHSKVGGRPGKPAYRTPSDFRERKSKEILKKKPINQKNK